MQVHVVVTGLDHVEDRLTRLGTSLHDFSGAFTGLAVKLIAFFGETVFASKGAALGKTWAPLAASTDREKAKNWPGRDIEVRTGTMQQGFYPEVEPTSLFIGNRASYFPYQQLGTGVGKRGGSTISTLGSLSRAYAIGGSGRGRGIPARPMIGVNATVEDFIRVAIKADITAKIESTNV